MKKKKRALVRRIEPETQPASTWRKTLCTGTLFVAFVGLFVASCFVQVPNHVFRWMYPTDSADATTALPWWVCFHIIWPLSVLFLIGIVVTGLWYTCGALCAYLRGEEA